MPACTISHHGVDLKLPGIAGSNITIAAVHSFYARGLYVYGDSFREKLYHSLLLLPAVYFSP